MAAFFLLVTYASAVVLLCKIAVFLYDNYIMRKKLSHIPGLTSFPLIGTLAALLQTEEGRMNWFLSLLNEFKDGIFLLWVGPRPLVWLYKPEMIKAILSNTMHLNKSKGYDFLKNWLSTGLVTSTGKQWSRDRKLLSPIFHFKMLEQFSAIMSEKAEIMLTKLEKAITENPGKFINVTPIIDHGVLEVVFDTIMGINTHTLEAKSNYINNTQKFVRLIAMRLSRPWFMVDWIFKLFHVGREYYKTLHELKEFTKGVVQEKLAHKILNNKSQNNHDDFKMTAKPRGISVLEYLLHLNDENITMSTEEFISHIDTFMFAAYDTTSTTISWALYCLSTNLEHQEKLHEEIDKVFQDSQGPATTEQISQLKYLDRVIKESIRLYPTVPLIARRLTSDSNIDGYTIPKDTTIILSIMLLHRNPSVWPDPLKYDPDRFLPENVRNMHPYAYIPFSAGSRNCIGQRFGLLGEKIMLTAILRKWRIKSVETPTELCLSDSNILRPYHGAFHMYFVPKK